MKENIVRLGEVQKGMYFECQTGEPLAYNISLICKVEMVQVKILEDAFKLVIAEQEALRSKIKNIDDHLVIEIDDEVDFKIQYLNECQKTEREIFELIQQITNQPFKLDQAPLLRVIFVEKQEKEQVLAIAMHHIISDGMSANLLLRRVFEYYHLLLEKKEIIIKQDSGYANYMNKEYKRLNENKFNKKKKYWLEKLQGASPLEISPDFSIQEEKSGIGKQKVFSINEQIVKAVDKISAEIEVSPFTIYLGAFSILMSKYANTDDVVVAVPFTYRPGSELENTIGCFIHTLPLRFNVKGECSIADVIKQASEQLMGAYKNIGYPNNLIARDSSLLSVTGAPSIFDISFVYDLYEGQTPEVKEIVDTEYITFPGNMMVILQQVGEELSIKFQYKTELYADKSIEYMGERYLKILETMQDSIETKIDNVDLLIKNEANKILKEFNKEYSNYTPQCVAEVFEEKVQRCADEIGMIYEGGSLTYKEIDEKINQIAHQIYELKKSDNGIVGIQLKRSPELVVAILAVLKAGCAYIPIDESYPDERKQFIMEDAAVEIYITQTTQSYLKDSKAEMIFIDDISKIEGNSDKLNIVYNPESLAYIEYTSGSTGMPKGVMIENHSIINVVSDLERRFPLDKEDIYMFKTPYTFDISGTEIYGWIVGNGKLFILPAEGEKNPELILDCIDKYKITHINFVPSLFRIFLELLEEENNLKKMDSIKYVFVGGEAVTVDIIKKFFQLNTQIKLENVYGPTEATMWATHFSIREVPKTVNVSVGNPLYEYKCYIVNDKNKLQPIGIPGELCISGPGLARGYLKRMELTEKMFGENPFYDEACDTKWYKRMYHTGDLARWLPDGNIEFMGRIDSQVKVNGIRIELGEVENALSQFKGIVQVGTVIKQDMNSVICAYYCAENEIPAQTLRAFLADKIPVYMIPTFFVHLKEMPLNSSGKLDRKALMRDKSYLKNVSTEIVIPITQMQKEIADIWKEILGVEQVGIDDKFFELGGTSLALMQVQNKLKSRLGIQVDTTTLLRLPTIRLIEEHVHSQVQNVSMDRKQLFKKIERTFEDEIAIIGMAVDVPGAEDIQEFWDNLISSKESIHFYSDDELRKLGVEEELLQLPNYIKAKGSLDSLEYFDDRFFNISPKEVSMTSPQLRVLYKNFWRAMEDAGYDPEAVDTKISAFIGGSDDFEWYKNALFNNENYSDMYQVYTLSTNHFLATRLAYKFNLEGPAMSALTGCSTSLITVYLACQSLILEECDMAVAGGVTVELPNDGGYIYEDGMMFSPDGHCRPFDADARGTVFSNGAGLVVLKRLSDAIKDNDHIYAVIKGAGVNNDGSKKMSYTAPSENGQVGAIQRAYMKAGIDPETIRYVEAHGTGTLLGDPIEVNSLTRAFETDKKQYCILGSVKGNVGHTDTAAGVVGLIKVGLCLDNKFIPGTVNYNVPNPKINFAETPFIVKNTGEEWKKEDEIPRRAGINSFGVGGTNIHMVLEEAPDMVKSNEETPINLFTFSAKSEQALNNTIKSVLSYIAAHQEINVSDAAWTIRNGRRNFKYRKAIVLGQDFRENLLEDIDEFITAPANSVGKVETPIVFMFSGQGSQYQGMGKELYYGSDLYGISKSYKKYVDQVFDLLPQEEKDEFFSVIFGNEFPDKINQTRYSQFALFVTEYSLAKVLLDMRIKPKALMGHSIGEVVAATISEVWSLEDAVKIVRMRGDLMQAQDSGAMIAVMASEERIRPLLSEHTWISLCNTTDRCVIGGYESEIQALEEKLVAQQIKVTRVRTSHAFHTPMMKEAAQKFEEALSRFKLSDPKYTIISNVTGKPVKPGEMSVPGYWAKHIENKVNFDMDLNEVLKDEALVGIEVGPGRTLCSFANQHKDKKAGQAFINILRHIKENENDVQYVYTRLGKIWTRGIQLDWTLLNQDEIRNRVSLPAYRFDKKHYPIRFKNIFKKSEVGGIDTQYETESEIAATIETVDMSSNSIEEKVIMAYKEIFGFEEINSTDDFFDMGGDSLKAASLIAVIKKLTGTKIKVQDIFSKTTPKQLAAHISKNQVNTVGDLGIVPVEKKAYYALSSSQRRMYTFYLLDKEELTYNLPSVTVIKGKLDKQRVEMTIQKWVERHESLRTYFAIRNNEVVQLLSDINMSLPIRYSEQKYENEEDLKVILNKFIRPFDLEKGPLFRVEIVKVRENEHLFLFDIHHIIADGTSVEILVDDFNKLYYGELEPLKVQYKDYAAWQCKYMKSEEMKEKRRYWLDNLSGNLPTLELPTDFERPRVSNSNGGRIYFDIGEELFSRVKEISHKYAVTNFMVMLSAWNILLARYSGQEDIIVGTPVSGRTRDEVRRVVGMFINMLPIRSFPKMNKKFSEFIDEVKQTTLGALSNQDYQFDQLVEELNVKRELNRNTIFDVSFDYHNMDLFSFEIEGLEFNELPMPVSSVSIDLILTCNEFNNRRLECFIDYSSSLFKRETVERIAEQFKQIVYSITSNPEIRLGEIELLTAEEKHLIFNQINANRLEIDEEILVHEMFERQVEMIPEKIAVVCHNGSQMTYKELNQKANILAWKLIELGVKQDTLVGILPDRDEYLLVAMLGILKAGGAYVPIDTKFPKDRVEYMLKESNVKILVCSQDDKLDTNFDGTIINCAKLGFSENALENPSRRSIRESLIYVIFTSGSTGMPKGVLVKQEGIVNLIYDHIHRQIFSREDDRIACIATPSFDIFACESLVPLCAGCSIYMANEVEQIDVNLLGERIKQYHITHIQSTIARLRAMIDNKNLEEAISKLRVIIGGGENYPVSVMKYFQEHTRARLYNSYGPTEATIVSTIKDLSYSDTINIGKPLANTQVYILSENGMIQPIGVYGELCIAGKGLARGYLNRKEETEKRFVQLASKPEITIYHTGDKARMLANGEIEIVGRLDSQVKVRGYRIELDEIEKVAMQAEDISGAVAHVINNVNGNGQIVLFYAVNKKEGSLEQIEAKLKQLLEEKLPNYMMPAYFIHKEEIPLLPNGKVNKKALTMPEKIQNNDVKKVKVEAAHVLPANKLEKEIIDIWKEVLGVSQVTVNDNFFDIGGNSFGLMLVNNHLNTLLGKNIPLMRLFENPTISSLIKFLKIDNGSAVVTQEEKIDDQADTDEIAIIGMYCKVPEAEGIDELWKNIIEGKECIRKFTEEELRASGIPEEEFKDPKYVNAKGYLEGVEYFDSNFFNYSKKEASVMDPQIRLLHACVWNAIEDAGYNPYEYDGKIGLFAGSSSNLMWMSRYLVNCNDSVSTFEAMTLNDKDFITTKVSYKLNLKGPSVNVQTACSTSLVAVHQAIKYLQCGEADIAVAGGISITQPRKEGYLWHEGMIYAKDGHCRPFSEGSTGTVAGNGCGVVVLKKLNKAIQDHDHIYAVIKGSAINNDGLDKIGYTAPSILGQRDVIEKAVEKSRINPEQIQYVEAHGTGTALGDPIELEALRQAWKTNKQGYCAIGSVKANLGHLDAAAGVIGLIKAALVVKNHMIPPLINFTEANKRLDIEHSPFYITTKCKAVESEKMIAAVSAFGIGGTNVHVILEDAPILQEKNNNQDMNILVFSARSKEALEKTSTRLIDYICKNKEINLSDVAWTLQVGRGNFEYRKAIVVKGKQLQEGNELEKFKMFEGQRIQDGEKEIVIKLLDEFTPNIGFDESIYDNKNELALLIKQHVEEVLNSLDNQSAIRVRSMLYRKEDYSNVRDLAVFTYNYAITQMLSDIGIEVSRIVADHIGKINALVLVNAMNLVDAISLITSNSVVDKARYNSPIPIVSEFKQEEEIVIGMDSTMSKAILINGKLEDIYKAIARLWEAGLAIDWNILRGEAERFRIALPGYIFDKIHYESDVVLSNLFDSKGETKEKNTFSTESIQDIKEGLGEIWNEVLGIKQVEATDDFFNIGGDSLNAILMASIIQKKMNIEMSITEIFNHSVFSKMVDWLFNHKAENNFEEIPKIGERPYYETSSGQKTMYAANGVITEGVPYNLASVYKAEGKLEREKIERTFRELVRRHEAFRTSFGFKHGELVQYITTEDLPVVEFVEVDEAHVEEEIQKSIKPFDLGKPSLMRLKIISTSEENHYLILDMHHIIGDQTSIAILLDEIPKLYKGEVLPKLETRYVDFAAWQNELLKNGEIEKQLNYWKQEFADNIPKLDLKTDFVRPQILSHEGNVVYLQFGKENSDKVREFIKSQHITGYMLMMAAFKLLLYKYTGQSDIIVGTAVAGRKHISLNSIVGMFVNTLPIRSQVDEELTIEAYLQYIKEKMLSSFENQDCQFDMLLDELNIERKLSNSPLFDVAINYVNMGTEELTLGDLKLTPYEEEGISTKYDITLTVIEKSDEYVISVEYATALFKESTIELFAKRFIGVVNYLLDNSKNLVKEVKNMMLEEKQVLDNNVSNAPLNKNVVELFEKNVMAYGNHMALEWENEKYTYAQLNSVVNQLAEKIAKQGIGYGDKVAILLDRGADQIISILAILKCGAVYVPIDVEYPAERINFILEDCNAKLVISYRGHEEKVNNVIAKLLLDMPENKLDASKEIPISSDYTPSQLCGEDEMYIIYTSGSTGTPKGTILCHKGVIRTVIETNYMNISSDDVLTQLVNYTFDPSVLEIFSALLNGASLIMIPKEVLVEMPKLAEVFEKQHITSTVFITAIFNMLVDYNVEVLKKIDKIFIGGEAMSMHHTRKALECVGAGHIVNLYGPTEGTICATYYPVDTIKPDWTSIPIGYAISDTTLYIVDEEGNLVPPNVPGELCIGGPGVAKGYLNREDVTAQKFVNLKFGSGERVYKTGDRVVLTSEGTINFLGRIDFQVKINGFRIELGEIEQRIALIEGIKDVIVVSNKDSNGSLYIAAYYTVVGSQYDYLVPDYIRGILKEQIPSYMIPARMMCMEKLPVNSNGKIDRKALPVIYEEKKNQEFNDRPRNEVEKAIIEAMQEVLDNPNVGIYDDFFALGGRSIKAIALTQSLREVGIELQVNDVFQNPTAEKLAKLVNAEKEEPTKQQVMNQEDHRMSLNEVQANAIIQHTCYLVRSLSDMIGTNQIVNTFQLSAIQKFHRSLGSTSSGFTMCVEDLQEAQLKNNLADIIIGHQMLHCMIDKEDTNKWNEFDIASLKPILVNSIAYSDLSIYDDKTQDYIIKQVYTQLMYTKYEAGELAWRLACFKLNDKTIQVVWCFNHISFDGMSAEIIKRQIKDDDVKNCEQYKDYIDVLKNGPIDITEETILEKFKLAKWKKANTACIDKLKGNINKESKECTIIVPLTYVSKNNIWKDAFEFATNVLKEYLDEDFIPFTMLNYARKYQDIAYYNCIGEFLDMVPVMCDETVEESETYVSELMKLCQTLSINFLTLLDDDIMPGQYEEIKKQVKDCYTVKPNGLDLMVYNFQGYITEEEKKLFEQDKEREEGEDEIIVRLLVDANYDEENLYVSMVCLDGINTDKVNGIVKKYSNEIVIKY